MHQCAVRIEHGYHLNDTSAWVCQRTGEPLPELTDALGEFIHHPVFALYQPQMDTTARMQVWCAARGWTSSEETTFYHDQSSLTEPVSIVLAVGSSDGVEKVAYALVQVGDDAPQVYLDVTTDDGYWLQVEPVDIVCPTGHRWTWLDHTSLLDSAGGYVRSPTCSATDRVRRTPSAAHASPTTTASGTSRARARAAGPSTARPATSGAGSN